METSWFMEHFLNGMPVGQFFGNLVWALAGVLVFFMIQIHDAVKFDKRTPDKFNWLYLLKTSGTRIVVGFICIWVTIVYFGDVMKMLGVVSESIKITGWFSFIIGVAIDGLVKGILSMAKKFIPEK